MSKDLMIPGEIPEYAMVSADVAKEMYADAINGISAGAPPAIRVKGGKFRIVEGGEETTIKALVEGQYLPVVVLAAKRALNKTYYAAAYDPANEPEAPDCWSLDSEKPDASIKNPVCATCAACPMNAFGSGRNAAGQPTKGKACTDTKIVAVAYNGAPYALRIPPASLKGFGSYVRGLQARNVLLGAVVTFLSLDDDADFPKLEFKVGAFVPRDKFETLADMAKSPEVHDITHPSFAGVVAPGEESTDDSDKEAEAAAAKAKEDAKKEAAAAAKKKAAAKAKEDAEKEAAAKAKKEAAAPAKEPTPPVGEDDVPPPSDEELQDLLGF